MSTVAMILAWVALFCGLAAARSTRGGFSGQVGTWLSIPSLIATVAAIVMLAMLMSWWTVLAFVIISITVGAVIPRDALAWWVSTQPVWMALTILISGGLWAWYALSY